MSFPFIGVLLVFLLIFNCYLDYKIDLSEKKVRILKTGRIRIVINAKTYRLFGLFGKEFWLTVSEKKMVRTPKRIFRWIQTEKVANLEK